MKSNIIKSKKGQLGNLQGIIFALIIVGILLGAGFFILDEFLNQTDNVVASVTNESGAYINSTGYTLNDVSVIGFNSPTIVQIVNATDGDGTIIANGNYTLSSAGVLTNATATTWADVNVSYSYLKGSSAFTGVNQTITAMLVIPSLLGLVVLIAMVGIILAIVFNVIPGARVSGA